MSTLVIITFIIGYIVIALEHPLKLNKAAPALFTGVICWTIYMLSGVEQVNAGKKLLENLHDISAILFLSLTPFTSFVL